MPPGSPDSFRRTSMRTQGGKLIERKVKWIEYEESRGSKRIFGKYTALGEYDGKESKKMTGRVDSGRSYIPRMPQTVGWGFLGEKELVDCKKGKFEEGIVMDPFCGTGTTGEVALKFGRSFIGIDLYEEFAEMTEKRCKETLAYLNQNKLNPWKLHN